MEQLGEAVPFNASFADNEYYAKYVTASPDGTVVFGNDTQSISAKFNSFFPSIVVGKKYMLSVDASGGNMQSASVSAYYIPFGTSFVLTEEQYGGEIYLSAGIDDNGEAGQPVDSTFKFSLVEVTDVLLDTPVTALDIVGANTLKYPYRESTITVNGITFTDNGDGSITVNGTATGSAYFRIVMATDLQPNVVHTLSGTPSVSGLRTYIAFSIDGKWYKEFYNMNGKNATFTTEEGCLYNVQILVDSGATISNAKVYPMLNRGADALSYSPYHKTTFAIPAAVQALDGYGKTGYGIEWDDNGKAWWYTPDGRTDISQYFTEDNLIPVEGGGTITAVNENSLAAPTTIVYQATGQSLADAFDEVHQYAMQVIGGNA